MVADQHQPEKRQQIPRERAFLRYQGRFAPLVKSDNRDKDEKARKPGMLDGRGHGAAIQNPVASGKAFVYKTRHEYDDFNSGHP
jgi:hypothetical protein